MDLELDLHALYDAAQAGDADAMAKIDMLNNYDNGETVLQTISKDELDALYDAAIAGDADAIAELEKQANGLDEEEYTILHTESRNGNTERVRFILREFASKNLLLKLGYQDETALHLAVNGGHTQLAKVLIDAARHLPPSANDNPLSSFQAFLRHADDDWETALHFAVMQGNVDVVKLLVEADPTDRHIQNYDGKTPMYIAVEKGYNDIVEIISTTCSAPSLDGPYGSTALPIKNRDQVKIPGGTLYKIMDKDAVFDAAIAGDADAKAKLEKEADKLDGGDRTILHNESRKGNIERVRFIVREFASKNLLVKLGCQQETALTWAAYNGHTEVVEILIDAARQLPPSLANDNSISSFQAFLRHADQDKETAFYAAVKRSHVAIVKLLAEADPGDSTALHAVIKNPNHNIKVVEALIGAARLLPSSSSSDNDDDDDDPVTCFQAFLRQADEDSNTVLHVAVMQGNLATAKLLVEADPTDRHTPNNQGKTPFYIAVERGYADIVKMICSTCTASFDWDGPRGHLTALHAIIKNLDEDKNEVSDVLKMITDIFKRRAKAREYDIDEYTIYTRLARIFFHRPDEDKEETILLLAVERNYLNVVKLILDVQNPAYREHWIGDDFISLMPLIYRAKDKGYKNIDKILTERYEVGAKLSAHRKKQASLISAIRRRDAGSASHLLDNDGNELVTFIDRLGWTTLHHAAYNEFNSIIYSIIEKQKKFKYLFRNVNTVTPFHIAAKKGYTFTVILLMELWPSWSSTYTAVDENGQNILHLAALQSKKEMILGILKHCSEECKNQLVNMQDNNGNTPLHLLIQNGCFVQELIKYEGFDLRMENNEKWSAPDMLYVDDQIINDQVKIKIVLDHFQIDQKRDIFSSSVLSISKRERKDVFFKKKAQQMTDEKLLRMKEDTRAVANCFGDAIAGDPISKAALETKADALQEEGKTILHVESMRGDVEHVQYIVREFANRNLLGKVDRLKQTALHLAAHHGHTQVVQVLINAAKHFPSSSVNDDTHNPVTSFQAFIRKAKDQMGNTALHLAVLKGNKETVKLLVEADPNDSHVQNNEGKTPIYIAAENGYKDIVKEICATCTDLSLDGPDGRTSALHALIQNIGQEGASDVIKMMVNAAERWSSADFEALFSRTDELGSTVLQLAVERNCVDFVRLILQEDPAYKNGREIKRNSLMGLIFKAIDKKCSVDIIKLLSQMYEAGIINPHHKDVVALILAIRRRNEDSVLRLLGGAKHLVTFTEDNGWTPLHYAVCHEFDSILGAIIGAQEDVGHQFVYGNMVSTPFHVAVKYGFTSTLVLLMQLWPASSSESIAPTSPYTLNDENGRNILHLAAAGNKKEMVQGILKYCPEKHKDEILKQQDINGDTPLHLLISHGCFIPELIKHKGLDTMAKNKNNFTPRDMLYLKNEIVAEQVHIKIALDDVQTNQSRSWKLWAKSTEKKTDIWKSIVPPSKRRIKDVILDERKILVMDAKHEQMKKDVERYKMRTNTQIIVTALITTVTFTVGFTMPGGLRQSGEVDEGLVVLTRHAVFNAFMVSDALALLLSTCSLFLYFLESMYEDPGQVKKLNAASVGLNIVSVMAMMLTFITGTYLVLSHSPALAITVCLIGSFFFIFVIVLLIKFVYDRQVKRNED